MNNENLENLENLRLAQKVIAEATEAKVTSQLDFLTLVTSMPLPDEDKYKIILASLALAIDLIKEKINYHKTYIDKIDRIEESLEQIKNR